MRCAIRDADDHAALRAAWCSTPGLGFRELVGDMWLRAGAGQLPSCCPDETLRFTGEAGYCFRATTASDRGSFRV